MLSTEQSTTCGQNSGVILDTLTCLNGQLGGLKVRAIVREETP